VPVESSFIHPPSPKYSDGDIVKAKDTDGHWYYFFIHGYADEISDVYSADAMAKKENGSWGYIGHSASMIDQVKKDYRCVDECAYSKWVQWIRGENYRFYNRSTHN